jgi:hypothetical protein
MYEVEKVARCKRVMFGLLFVGVLISFFSFSSLGASSVNLTWLPTPDSGVVGYNVYYGNGSRSYQNQIPVGNNLTALLSGLTAGTKYYFAVTAIDAFGIESDFSGEASYLMPGNQAPTISPISPQTVMSGQATAAIPFTVGDAETAASNLTVSATSSSTT